MALAARLCSSTKGPCSLRTYLLTRTLLYSSSVECPSSPTALTAPSTPQRTIQAGPALTKERFRRRHFSRSTACAFRKRQKKQKRTVLSCILPVLWGSTWRRCNKLVRSTSKANYLFLHTCNPSHWANANQKA